MFEPVVMSPVPGQNASVTNFFPAQLAGIHDIGNSVVLGSKNFRGSTVAVIAASLVPAIRTGASCVYISSFRGQLQVQVHRQGPRPVAGARADFCVHMQLGGRKLAVFMFTAAKVICGHMHGSGSPLYMSAQ